MSWLDKRILVGTNVSTWLPTRYGPNGPDGTRHYVPIIIQASQVSSALTDFPVYVDLSTLPAAFWANVQSDGGDIRVATAAGVQVPAELVSINTGSETGELHFLASSVSSSSNTEFRIYYDGETTLSQPGVATTYGRNAVWADYEAVYHLGEDPGGSAPQFVDSTGNGNDASGVNLQTSDQVAGEMGDAVNLDGSGEHIDTNSKLNTDGAEDLTVQAWALFDTTAVDQAVVGRWRGDTNVFLLYMDADGANPNLRGIVTATGSLSATDTSTGAVSAGSWIKADMTWSENDAVSLYKNGAFTNAGATSSGVVVSDFTHVGIGSDLGSVSARELNGKVDEVRVSLQQLNANWLSAEYSNQNTPSAFYNVGSQANA